MLYNDYDSTYEDLICNERSSTLLLSWLKSLLLETFKSLRHTNAERLHIFHPKMSSYDLKTTNIVQPKRNTTTYGLRSFSYLGSRLWNNLVTEFPFLCHIDYNGLKEFIKDWTGPKLDDGFNYISIYFYSPNVYICHFTCPESLIWFLPFMYIIVCILLYSTLMCILCCTVHMLHILLYTTLLANVVCFTYDSK